MYNNFPGGVWPVMLTPFTKNNEVDYKGLSELTEWYIEHGASGLFAVTQSSEMFFLTLEERVNIAAFVCRSVDRRVPVIASGHISENLSMQAEEINKLAETGVDAVILVTNRLAQKEESDEIWIENLSKLLVMIPDNVKLGLYECPYPYKRIMSNKMTDWCARSGRFYFLKDTSCDIENIRMKLRICEGSNLKLYNANTATLLESLFIGAAGYSGVMANMQCSLYAKLCRDYKLVEMSMLSEILTICALIEKQWYPVNAKYYQHLEGLSILTKSRVQDDNKLTDTLRKEVKMLKNITAMLEMNFLEGEKSYGG